MAGLMRQGPAVQWQKRDFPADAPNIGLRAPPVPTLELPSATGGQQGPGLRGEDPLPGRMSRAEWVARYGNELGFDTCHAYEKARMVTPRGGDERQSRPKTPKGKRHPYRTQRGANPGLGGMEVEMADRPLEAALSGGERDPYRHYVTGEENAELVTDGWNSRGLGWKVIIWHGQPRPCVARPSLLFSRRASRPLETRLPLALVAALTSQAVFFSTR